MMRHVLMALLGLTILIGGALPAFAGNGAGAIVLSFPVGARFNALGEAGVALSQNATANWFNPAGLASMDRAEGHNVEFMYSKLAEGLADDIRIGWLGYAGGFAGGGFGASFTYLNMGEQTATDEDGGETGTFKSYEFAAQAAMAFRLNEFVNIGMGAKYFRDKLADDAVLKDGAGGSGDSYGVDLGVLCKIKQLNLNAAAVASNLGYNNDIKHVDADQADPMPRKITIGFAQRPVAIEGFAVLLVADYQLPLFKWKDADGSPADNGGDASDEEGLVGDYVWGLDKSQEEFGFGIEVQIARVLAPRIGWKSAKYGDINSLTYGFGIDLSTLIEQNVEFSFASVPQAESLPSVKRISLGVTW